MSETDLYSPSRIADRLEIQEVIMRWCRAVDRLDFEALRLTYHPDAVDIHGPYSGDIDGLIAWMRSRHEGIPFSSHQVGNILIDFASANVALAETYVRTIQSYPAAARASLAQLASPTQVPDGDADLLTSSRYVDVFERRHGAWKIRERSVIHDWKRVFPNPGNSSQPAYNVPGRRDRDDPSYKIASKLGIAI